MIHVVCQDMKSTSTNHAGMKHMCYMLVCLYPEIYSLHVFPDRGTKRKKSFFSKLENRINRHIIIPFERIIYAIKLVIQLEKGDTVFLTEYYLKEYSQKKIARILKIFHPGCRCLALAHLTPSLLEYLFTDKEIKKWAKNVDVILTLGSTLSNYFTQKGVLPSVKTLFHYVDLDYYKISSPRNISNRVTVIAMGALQRNYSLLAEIVKAIPEVDFIICKGRANVDSMFTNCNNIKLVGFVPENDLRDQMNHADISLNVLDDTVGSNVITTSLAMGLAIVASNVGSITDYCDDENSILCDNKVNSFVESIRYLNSNREILANMKLKSLEKAQAFHVSNFHNKIMELINK